MQHHFVIQGKPEFADMFENFFRSDLSRNSLDLLLVNLSKWASRHDSTMRVPGSGEGRIVKTKIIEKENVVSEATVASKETAKSSLGLGKLKMTQQSDAVKEDRKLLNEVFGDIPFQSTACNSPWPNTITHWR